MSMLKELLKNTRIKMKRKANGKTIAIDFDGVIHKYSKGWCDGVIYDEPIEYAFETISAFYKIGYSIILFTVRPELEPVIDWMKENVPEDCKFRFKITNKKPGADIYIDDRGYRFENWPNTFNEVTKILEQAESWEG